MRQITAPYGHRNRYNGLNFAKSVDNDHSRLNRVLDYLVTGGMATKRQILKDVFHIEISQISVTTLSGDKFRSRGWASIMFTLGVKCGFLRHKRVGNTVLWSAGPKVRVGNFNHKIVP